MTRISTLYKKVHSCSAWQWIFAVLGEKRSFLEPELFSGPYNHVGRKKFLPRVWYFPPTKPQKSGAKFKSLQRKTAEKYQR